MTASETLLCGTLRRGTAVSQLVEIVVIVRVVRIVQIVRSVGIVGSFFSNYKRN